MQIIKHLTAIKKKQQTFFFLETVFKPKEIFHLKFFNMEEKILTKSLFHWKCCFSSFPWSLFLTPAHLAAPLHQGSAHKHWPLSWHFSRVRSNGTAFSLFLSKFETLSLLYTLFIMLFQHSKNVINTFLLLPVCPSQVYITILDLTALGKDS